MAEPSVGVLFGPSEYSVLVRGDTMRFRFAAHERIDAVLRPMDMTVFDTLQLAILRDRAAATALYVFTLTVLTDAADKTTDPVSGLLVANRFQTTTAYLNAASATAGNVVCRVFGKIGGITVQTIGKYWKAGLFDAGAVST